VTTSGFPLAPGAVIGVLGGGQLGRMLALAAARLGFDVAVLTPETDSPAGRVAAHTIVAAYDDPGALAELARLSSAVTFEFENVPAAVVATLESLGVAVAPGPKALAVAQDRVAEKSFCQSVGVPTVAFAAIDRFEDIASALDRLGAPALLKTRREGYDGKGQVWIKDAAEAEAAWTSIGAKPAILEARADFVREVSLIAARGRDGSFAAYPLTENQHEDGILRRSIAPARASETTAAQARSIVDTITAALDYVGVVGVELFELADGRLLVNEMAPRVHNSGHWTLDACEVDQFEQQVRAVAGWPLGPTAPFAEVEMLNLLGAEADDWQALAADPSARVWLYGKRGARAYAARRKMGHVNRLRPLR
jgi:5-(carboxyamino)imidazole ribonucleotide synthase